MSNFDGNSSPEQTPTDLDSDASLEVKQLLASLQHSHQLRSKMINLETCALAETMDEFLPGFWSRFLENRRTSLKQFLRQKRANQANNDPSDQEPSAPDYDSPPLN